MDIMGPPNSITSISNANMPLVPGLFSSIDQPGEVNQAGDGELQGLAVNFKTKVQPKHIENLCTGYV